MFVMKRRWADEGRIAAGVRAGLDPHPCHGVPLVFAPLVDFGRLAAPSIIDAF